MIDFDKAKDNALEDLQSRYDIGILENDSDDVPKSYKLSRYWLVKLLVDSSVFGFDQLELVVGLPKEFPLVLPKIFLSKKHKGEITTLPHIDQNRFICTYDEERAVPNPRVSADQIQHCLLRAKKIIEAGLKRENVEDYMEEFVAYWQQTYNDEEKVCTRMLSSITEVLNAGDKVYLLVLNKKLGYFNSIVIGKCNSSNQFRKFLDDWKYEYSEYQVFYAGSLNFGDPPYNLRNRDLYKLIIQQEKKLQDQFFAFLKLKQNQNIVLFDNGIDGHMYLQGLRIHKLPHSAKGFREGAVTAKLAFQSIATSKKIQRISLIPIHSQRLQRRTAGVLADPKKINRFAIAGLGSIGSNLMYFLSSFSNPSFYLTDPDDLDIVNITRHFLGLVYTGQYKVSALKHYFQHSNPNIKIASSPESIIRIIDENPDDLNTYDILFICIGKRNIEQWVADALNARKLSMPLCFIWVEPYLLGGHALYIHPEANHFQEYFDDDGFFHQNVISSNEYSDSNQLLSLRESGCQSTFRPYSQEKVILFLSKLFPHLRNWISEKPRISESFTWIGYEEDNLKGKIKLSEWIEKCDSDFTIITK
jgi:hypothetical protein